MGVQFAAIKTAALCVGMFPISLWADDVTVTGFNQGLDLVCQDSLVVIEGFNNVLKITGDCRSIALSGVENSVDFESAGLITMIGANNRATGAVSGPGGAGAPDVTLSGATNVLALRFDRPAEVEISGSGNTLIWTTAPNVGRPQIRISGENNNAQNP